MDSSETPPVGENKIGVDPLTFIFWGILLAGYGLFAAYSSYINPLETEKLLAIGPYAIVVVFGILVAARGLRDYRTEKKIEKRVRTRTGR